MPAVWEHAYEITFVYGDVDSEPCVFKGVTVHRNARSADGFLVKRPPKFYSVEDEEVTPALVALAEVDLIEETDAMNDELLEPL